MGEVGEIQGGGDSVFVIFWFFFFVEQGKLYVLKLMIILRCFFGEILLVFC